MSMEPPSPFGALLRNYRLAARLTQEALAERAATSRRSIQAFERGESRPRQETLRRLATALALGEPEYTSFVTVAAPGVHRRSTAPARGGARATGAKKVAASPASQLSGHHPFAMPAHSQDAARDSPDQPHHSLPAHSAPLTGTLTFLMTDVEGSTPLWEHHETTMRQVMARHDALLDGLISAQGGRRVRERGEGDSIFAVFDSPIAAVAAGCAIGQALLVEPWPAETPIRVRMAVHTGEAEWRAGDYYGPVVNRCARLRGLGHGGQILLSAATAALVRSSLPAGAGLRSLGAYTLKGVDRPEEIFQLCHPHLPFDFPPLLSPQAPKHNLPPALTSFIGRDQEQSQVMGLLAEHQLVTLVGAGGVGKTRLALAVASDLLDQYPDGVWLVELAALTDPALVAGAVAQAVGVREEPGSAIFTTLIEYLHHKQVLLVLDNCEHLLAACTAPVSTLLHACPRLRLLTTSREALRVRGEQSYRVPSLTVPDPHHLPPVALLGSAGAVRLFVTRARERQPEFALTSENARAVVELCARLDGIPLAIELAAARVGGMTVEAIATRLDDRFRLLTGGPRDALPRQRTLQAAIDWSYDLLTAAEQLVLARLSVFAGGWTLEAAEAVCAGDGIEGWEALDLLEGLVNKSLAQLVGTGEAARYGLLETVRHYAWGRLHEWPGGDRPERVAVQARHLTWYVSHAEHAAIALTGPQQGEWIARLEDEHDNLRAALAFSLAEPEHSSRGLALAGALWRFWHLRGYLAEGRRWLADVLARAPERGDPSIVVTRARALHGAGVLAMMQDDNTQSMALLEASLALYRESGDRQGMATALNGLGNVAIQQGAYAHAAERHGEALAVRRQIGDRHGVAHSLNNLAYLARARGDHAGAARMHEESLALHRELGDAQGVAGALNNLAGVARAVGDFVRAEALYRESLALRRQLGDQQGIASSLSDLATVLLEAGKDATVGIPLFRESLALYRALSNRWGIAGCLEGLAWAWRALYPERAVHLLSAAATIRREIAAPPAPRMEAIRERNLAALRADLGDAVFDAAWEVGQLTLPERLIQEALDDRSL